MHNKAEPDLDLSEFAGSEAFDFKYFNESRIEILDHGATKEEKVYPCCPDEIYPSVDFNVKFKKTKAVTPRGDMIEPLDEI